MITVQSCKEFAAQYLRRLPPAFGTAHMETTLAFAVKIASAEGIPLLQGSMAAICHDIGLGVNLDLENETITENHGIESAKLCRKFFQIEGMPADEIESICDAIASHCYPGLQKTLLAKLLWDADKLNMFAPEMEEPYIQLWLSKGLSEEAMHRRFVDYRQYYAGTFHTATAKRIAAGEGM